MFSSSTRSLILCTNERAIGSNLFKQYSTRTAVNPNPIPRRPAKKIKVGKSRPPIYYKFNCLVELSDGSVVERRSQYPKTEIRMIQDQRNNPLWNEHRSDMNVIENVKGKLYTFKQKYSDFDKKSESGESEDAKSEEAQDDDVDDLIELMGAKHVDKKLGGRIFDKRSK